MPGNLRLVVSVLVLAVASTTMGIGPVPGFTLDVPMAAGSSLPVGEDAGGSSTGGTTPLRVEGRLAFRDLTPGGPAAESAVQLRNDGLAPLRLSATAAPLVGPEGARIAATNLVVITPEVRGLLSGDVPLGTLAPGETLLVKVVLTPPHGDAQYLPAGAYRGALTLRAEVGA